MAVDVNIANIALSKLGAVHINSLEEQTNEAKYLRSIFSHVIDTELRAYPWSCTKTSAVLAEDAVTIVEGRHTYTLPLDCLRLSLYRNPTDWDIRGKKIVTDTATKIEVVYHKRVEDLNVLDPLCVEVIAAKLAIELCEKISQSNTKKQILFTEYKLAVERAREANAFELPPLFLPDDEWILTRF